MRKQSLRVEDIEQSESLALRLEHRQIVYKSPFGTQDRDLANPDAIRKQRHNCAPHKPSAVHRRGVIKGWLPRGYLKPRIILK